MESGSHWDSGSRLESDLASARQESEQESQLASGSALVLDSASASERAPESELGSELVQVSVPASASDFPSAPDSVMCSAAQPD